MNRSLAPVCLVAALAIATSLPASVVHRDSRGRPVAWDLDTPAPNVVDGRLTFHVDTAGVDAATGVPAEEFAAAVRRGVARWNLGSASRLHMEEDPGRPASRQRANDRVNRLGFSTRGIGPFTYAVTFRRVRKARFTDADIAFNPAVRTPGGVPLPWSTATPALADTADVEAVTAHEWGHAIGLDHVPLGRSTMYWSLPAGIIMTRSPERDDRAGAGGLYPAEGFDAAHATLRGTVAVAGTMDERGVQVVAVDAADGAPAAAAFSEPDGSWVITGLDPGVYRLLAAPIGRTRVRAGTWPAFWDGTPTALRPVVREDPGGAVAHLRVAAGETRSGLDFTLGAATLPGEPDGTFATARAVPMGGAATGRLESTADEDWLAFDATAGDRVSIHVRAWTLGSEADPRVDLVAPAGTTFASIRDDRAGPGVRGPDGFDLDATLADRLLPVGGTWRIRIRSDAPLDSDGHAEDRFWVAFVLPAGGPPDPDTGSLTVDPAVVDADGSGTAVAVFRPRSSNGTRPDPGFMVTMELVTDGDADASLGPVVDHGDGTYAATLTAPVDAAADTVRVRVDGQVFGTATVAWSGPVDAERSTFAVMPSRIRPGGTARALLVPRDRRGVALGAGRTTSFAPEGSSGVSADAAADPGDGSYTAVLRAGTEREEAVVAVQVDGVDPGLAAPLGVGFPLDLVLAESLATVEAALAGDVPGRRAVARRLENARARLVAADIDRLAGDTDRALRGVAQAARLLERATRGGASSAADLPPPLAEVVRQAAVDAIAAATIAAATTADERRVARAERHLAAGDARIAAGRSAAAAARWRKARALAARVAGP